MSVILQIATRLYSLKLIVNGEEIPLNMFREINDQPDYIDIEIADYNPILKRGLVCDIEYSVEIVDETDTHIKTTELQRIRDAVLVHKIGSASYAAYHYTPKFRFYK